MSRYRGWFLAMSLMIPLALMSAGCGNKTTPSADKAAKVGHSVKDAARNTKKAAHDARKKIPLYTTAPAKPPKGNAARGAKLFSATCESCHGRGGTGTGSGPRLAAPSPVGVQFGTEAALAAFIAHNMPASNPGSLNAGQAANAAAYVWHIAGK